MDLRYPIGKFKFEGPMTDAQRQDCLTKIEETPAQMRAAVAGLNNEQLETPYRPGGWSVRQVVHHVPDSHLNSYLRIKLAMTLDHPTIIAYDENIWAELADGRNAPIEMSLDLLDSLHQRWVVFLRSLSGDDFLRTFNHPEIGVVSVDKNIALYAWHGQHHVAHITALRERMDW